jgi:hypothetical protein
MLLTAASVTRMLCRETETAPRIIGLDSEEKGSKVFLAPAMKTTIFQVAWRGLAELLAGSVSLTKRMTGPRKPSRACKRYSLASAP